MLSMLHTRLARKHLTGQNAGPGTSPLLLLAQRLVVASTYLKGNWMVEEPYSNWIVGMEITTMMMRRREKVGFGELRHVLASYGGLA